MDDLYDISRSVSPVRLRSPALAEPFDAYTNGKSFFLTPDQVATLAAALKDGRITPGLNGGWEELVPDKGVRVLAERHINGGTYYRFRHYWNLAPVDGQSVPPR